MGQLICNDEPYVKIWQRLDSHPHEKDKIWRNLTPLMHAITKNRPAVVKALLSKSANVIMATDCDKNRCFHRAAATSPDILAILLDHVLRVNLPELINQTDAENRTALHWAASAGQLSSCQLLLAAGADESLHVKSSCDCTPEEEAGDEKTRQYLKNYQQLLQGWFLPPNGDSIFNFYQNFVSPC